MEIYIGWISGSCEDFESAHTTEEAVKADMIRWCKAYWIEDRDGPLPDNDDEVIRLLYRIGIGGIRWEIRGPIPLNEPYEPEGPRWLKPSTPPDPEKVTALREHHDKWRRDHPEWIGRE